jgi:polyhydroxyalkanoate synthase
MTALAAPNTFIWSRLVDAASSVADHHALDVHARVERWALDEVPLLGKLVHQIVEWLYREDRFCRGCLKVGETIVGPAKLSIPTLVVVAKGDEFKPFTDAMPADGVRIIEYPGEAGICSQHLGVLVGGQAHA